MKLLVVSNMYPSAAFPSYGVFVKNFTNQLDTLGIAYDLAVMRKAKGKLQKLWGYVSFYAGSFLKSLFGKYDAVYIHYASHSSAGVLPARKLRKFTIYTNCHGSDVIPENRQHEKMQKYTREVLALSEKIVVPSAYFKQVVSEKYAVSPEKIYVCASGGVNSDVFYPCADKQDWPFTMGYVGRISAGKGWDTLLSACALLDGEYTLRIVGDGPEKGAMLEKIRQLQLQDHIKMEGLLPQSALPQVYNSMDVFLFPTQRAGESLGLVALEAMACGVPVIASDFAAPAYYVADGKNGYKFPVGDSKSLADAICKFRSLSLETRQQLREGALETGKEYATEAVTAALKTILLE